MCWKSRAGTDRLGWELVGLGLALGCGQGRIHEELAGGEVDGKAWRAKAWGLKGQKRGLGWQPAASPVPGLVGPGSPVSL